MPPPKAATLAMSLCDKGEGKEKESKKEKKVDKELEEKKEAARGA